MRQYPSRQGQVDPALEARVSLPQKLPAHGSRMWLAPSTVQTSPNASSEWRLEAAVCSGARLRCRRDGPCRHGPACSLGSSSAAISAASAKTPWRRSAAQPSLRPVDRSAREDREGASEPDHPRPSPQPGRRTGARRGLRRRDHGAARARYGPPGERISEAGPAAGVGRSGSGSHRSRGQAAGKPAGPEGHRENGE